MRALLHINILPLAAAKFVYIEVNGDGQSFCESSREAVILNE